MATTYPQWEYDLLSGWGAPASDANLQALNLWAQSEGSVTNNPLATSGQGKGATKCVAQCGTTSPIYEYDNEADGVAQMLSFTGGSNSSGIVKAFVNNVGLAGIFYAINSSAWCKGCQAGKYPEALAAVAGGGSGSYSSSVGTGGTSTINDNATAAGGSGTSSTLGCAASGDVFSEGGIFGIGSFSFTHCQAKALVSAMVLASGVVVMGLGTIIVTAWGLAGTRVGKAATSSAKAVPGPVGKIAKAPGRVKAAGVARRQNRKDVADAKTAETEDKEAPRRKAQLKGGRVLDVPQPSGGRAPRRQGSHRPLAKTAASSSTF